MKLSLALATSLMLVSAVVSAAPRRALLVGSREGNPDQATLRYTSDDVRRLSSVLGELGNVPPATLSESHDPTAVELIAKLDALAQAERAELFVFYYSGHADGASLALRGTSLPLATLTAKIAAIPADLRIIILDACQSGAATRTKGVGIGPPIAVEARADSSSGDVFITSSSATEVSYESDASRAGIFSLHLATGLRGAADTDRDGAVTITEAYGYAYAQTLRSTMLTSAGSQHPTFRYAVAGQREPVLTRLDASAHVTLHANESGDFVLFDDREARVFAEVHVDKDQKARLSLPSGRYVVKKRGARDLKTAQIALAAKDDRVLEESQMPKTALLRLPPKGGLGNLALGLSAGQYWSALGEQGHLLLMLGPEWERSTWLFRGEVTAAFGTQTYNELETRQRSVGVAASALTGVRLESVFVRGGPLLGTEVIFQHPEGRPSRAAMAVRLGPRLRVDLPLSRNIGLYTTLDASLLAANVDGPVKGAAFEAGDLGFFGWVGYGIGLVNPW